MKTNNLVWHSGYLTKDARNKRNQHDSGVIWFTGLSAAGKSTIALTFEKWLFQQNLF
jgi:adenylylsulfate kinase